MDTAPHTFPPVAAAAPAGAGWTRLRMDATQFTLTQWLADTTAPRVWDLPLGARTLAQHHWPQTLARGVPPTAGQLEAAIEAAEDLLMPLARQLAPGSTLYGTETEWHTLAAAVPGDAPATVLTRDVVEDLFNRLAALSQGRPTTQDPLPPDGEQHARLLVLRELLHHLGFDQLVLAPPAAAPQA